MSDDLLHQSTRRLSRPSFPSRHHDKPQRTRALQADTRPYVADPPMPAEVATRIERVLAAEAVRRASAGA
jgi:hypothetical protein